MRGQVWHCMNGVWHKSPATCAFHSYCSWVIKVVVIVLGDFVWVGESLCLGWSQGDVGRCPGECALAGHEWRELKEKKGRMLKATKRVCKTRVNGQSDCYLMRFLRSCVTQPPLSVKQPQIVCIVPSLDPVLHIPSTGSRLIGEPSVITLMWQYKTHHQHFLIFRCNDLEVFSQEISRNQHEN